MALMTLIVALLGLCTLIPSARVAAQPSSAPAASTAAAANYTIGFNYSWDPQEQKALQDIIEEWTINNPNLKTILPGWSQNDPEPCLNLWEGVMCFFTEMGERCSANGENCTIDVIVYVGGLFISNTDLSGRLPPAIGNLTHMAYLSITGNQGLSGPIPSEIKGLSNLQSLDLHSNNFNGSIPEEIGQMTFIESIDLSNNNLTQTIPSTICTLPLLGLLQLSRNQLSGPIPGSSGEGLGLGDLSCLSSLSLEENNLTGGLPDLRNLTELVLVNVSHNQLSGSVILNSHFSTTATQKLISLDLSYNDFIGPIPDLSILNESLQQLDLSNNRFNSSTVPSWFSIFTVLRTLGLANLNLTGTVPTFFLDSSTLELLHLERNQFTGVLDLSQFSDSSLQLVNLTSNNITQVHYHDTLLQSTKVLFLLEHTPYCDATESENMTAVKYFFCRTAPKVFVVNDKYRTVIISISVTVSFAFLLVAVAALIFCFKNRRERKLYYLQIKEEFAKKHVQTTLYAYSDLRWATREFHPDMKLGQGAFGIVYKGVQPDGTELAVKQLVMNTQQGIDEFLNEVVLITGVRHRNLVKLKGCCVRDSRRLLVYEFVENNNLAEVLFEGLGEHDLNWGIRFNVFLGVAQGLHYLHESAQPRILHRDIKASNILLDKSLNAKIADFGLARLFPDEESHISTLHVAGTMGYMAPEYASRGQLTEKVDVFSFGVLVLEIVSGRKNIEPKLATGDIYLTELAWRLNEEGKPLDIVDPTMNIKGCEEEVERVINIALLCIQTTGHKRPSMARVVSMLKGETQIEFVTRESQFIKPQYASFLATAQSGSDITMSTIIERDIEGRPLLDSASCSRPASNPRVSTSVELTTTKPR